MEDEGDDVYIARCCFDAKGGISKEKTNKNKSANERSKDVTQTQQIGH